MVGITISHIICINYLKIADMDSYGFNFVLLFIGNTNFNFVLFDAVPDAFDSTTCPNPPFTFCLKMSLVTCTAHKQFLHMFIHRYDNFTFGFN